MHRLSQLTAAGKVQRHAGWRNRVRPGILLFHRCSSYATTTQFSELDLLPRVASCLDTRYPQGPMKFQTTAIPAVASSLEHALSEYQQKSGRDMSRSSSYGDVVLCSETGSGKTLSYAAPILSVVTKYGVDCASKPQRKTKALTSLVLCPNMVLVHQAATAITDTFASSAHGGEHVFEGRSLVEILDGGTAPCVDVENNIASDPIFYIATPAGLLRHLRTYYDKGRQRNFVQNVCSVVMDEADMLLSAYEQEVRDVLTMLVYGSAHEQGASMYARKDLAKFIARNRGRMFVPQLVCVGATLPGSVCAYVTTATLFYEHMYTVVDGAKKAPGSVLKKALHRATWVNSASKHQIVENSTFLWVNLDSGRRENEITNATDFDDRLNPLLRAVVAHKLDEPVSVASIETDPSLPQTRCVAQPLTCIIFCSSLNRAERLTQFLQNINSRATADLKIKLSSFHRNVPITERLQTISDWRNAQCVGKEDYRVLVCTDAASRGLDLPNVDVVIHADFATSAIDFVHRSGRTGRAGGKGVVISLLSQQDLVLATEIRSAVESADSTSLEATFSRKRSFRKKHKRAQARSATQ